MNTLGNWENTGSRNILEDWALLLMTYLGEVKKRILKRENNFSLDACGEETVTVLLKCGICTNSDGDTGSLKRVKKSHLVGVGENIGVKA